MLVENPAEEKKLENQSTEKRQSPRVAVENQAVNIATPDAEYDGVIIDESFGGIGVYLNVKPDIEVEQQVTVYWREALIVAHVRYIKPVENRFRVGLAWIQRVQKKNIQRKDSAEFFSYCGVQVVCKDLTAAAKGYVTFKYPDGSSSLKTPQELLLKQTIKQRALVLGSLDCKTLTLVAGVYQIAVTPKPIDTVNAILDHEFGM